MWLVVGVAVAGKGKHGGINIYLYVYILEYMLFSTKKYGDSIPLFPGLPLADKLGYIWRCWRVISPALYSTHYCRYVVVGVWAT